MIFEMFEMMIEKMSQVQTKIYSLETELSYLEKGQKEVKKIAQKSQKQSKDLNIEVNRMSESTLDLIQVAAKLENDVKSVSDRVEKLDRRMMKGWIVVKGVRETEDEDTKQTLANFFSTQMEIHENLQIQTAFRVGKGKYRLIHAKLFDPGDISKIYAHVHKLKDKKNEIDRFFNIDEQLTESNLQRKHRRQQLKSENRQLALVHQAKMEIKKGELYIENEAYKPEVEPPRCKDILLATQKHKDKFRGSNVLEGPTKTKGGSCFKAYAIHTRDFEEVKKAYLKIKDANLGVAHIMCGYRLFGPIIHNLQDYSDDGDYGLGTAILAELKTQGVFNIAVFVVRNYDGIHIGQIRFDIVRELVQEMLSISKSSLDYG